MKTEKWGEKYKSLQCGKCGKRTILRPIDVPFNDDGVGVITEIEGTKLPKVASLKEACEIAEEVHKVCTGCNFGEKIDKNIIHYWFNN